MTVANAKRCEAQTQKEEEEEEEEGVNAQNER